MLQGRNLGVVYNEATYSQFTSGEQRRSGRIPRLNRLYWHQREYGRSSAKYFALYILRLGYTRITGKYTAQ